jgi:hypothetical protein
LRIGLQVLWSIPGSDVTNSESLLGTVVLNVIFVFGLLVGSAAVQQQQQLLRAGGGMQVGRAAKSAMQIKA